MLLQNGLAESIYEAWMRWRGRNFSGLGVAPLWLQGFDSCESPSTFSLGCCGLKITRLQGSVACILSAFFIIRRIYLNDYDLAPPVHYPDFLPELQSQGCKQILKQQGSGPCPVPTPSGVGHPDAQSLRTAPAPWNGVA